MGGHGGLNILPQKSWNVYNRDNRTKVARDEAKARKKEAEEEERHLRAEREYRHKLLLRRAGREAPEEAAPQTADGLLASIFDNTEPESNAEHPENVEKRVEEQRRRGNPDTQTSDAKFDERFAFAFNMGKVEPWYAKKPVPAAPEDKPSTSGQPSLLQQHLNHQQQHLQQAPAAPASSTGTSSSSSEDSDSSSNRSRSRKRRNHSKKHRRRSSSSSSDSELGSGSASNSRRSRKRRRDRRTAKGHKSKHRRKERGKGDVQLLKAASGVKTIEELRQERLQRELAEKARSRSVLRASMAAEELPGVYNTSYGFAAALKKSRMGQ